MHEKFVNIIIVKLKYLILSIIGIKFSFKTAHGQYSACILLNPWQRSLIKNNKPHLKNAARYIMGIMYDCSMSNIAFGYVFVNDTVVL